MQSDIVERLCADRDWHRNPAKWSHEAADEIERLRAENARLREALTASGETKYAYIGEFSWTEWVDGQGYQRVVPWTVIKQIMAAILDRAGVDPFDDDADIEAALTSSNSPVVGEDGAPETIDGVETGNTVAPNTPTTAGRREAVARILADRWIERGKARITGSPYSSFDEMPGSYRDDFLADADALIAASLIAGPLPEGFVAAPVEPTNEMLHAGSDAAACFGTPLTRTANAYRAMIAARPGADA